MAATQSSVEPFKATKLWNMIIQEFRSGMPLKRHRKGLRSRPYDNCFTSSEAVEWLHEYLQNCDRFGPWVTKSQTISLLEKFLQSKVIQVVKGSTKGSSTPKFEDNGDLYRFVHVSPIKKLRSALSRSNLRSARTPLKTINSEPVGRTLSYDNPAFTIKDTDKESGEKRKVVPECRLVQRPLTAAQTEEVWQSATLTRLQRLLWLSSLDYLLGGGQINPKYIIHNCTHVSRNGVVLVPKDQDDLPHWVLSAMKCLANWPNGTESGLPNYPGFEKDVLKTVSNYFQSLLQPLLTHQLYNLIIESFVTAERRDRGLHPGVEESPSTPPDAIQGLASFQSVENLMLNMTSGGLFGFSPELAGAPGRQIGVRESADREVPQDAASKRLKMTEVRNWIGDTRGIPPSTVSSYRGEQRAGESQTCVTRSPATTRGRKIIQRSASMRVTGFVGNDGISHHNPRIWDGRQLSTQPQGMRRCISEPTRGPHGQDNSTSSQGKEHQARPVSSGAYHVSSQGINIKPQRNQRPLSAPIRQGTPKYPSASNLNAPDQQRTQGTVTGSRRVNSEVHITNSDSSRPRSMASTQGKSQSSIVDKQRDLNYGFPMKYNYPTEGRRHCGSMNDINNAATSNTQQLPKESTGIRNLFVSRRFGSASELFQKMFKKKSTIGFADSAPIDQDAEVDNHHSGSTPHLQEQQQPQSGTKGTPPNLINNMKKISPPYPPPLRATHSYSNLGSSRENSDSQTPDVNHQMTGLRATSSSDVRSSVRDERSKGERKLTRSDSTTSLYLSDDKSYTQEALKLCCLLLPPVSRRKLQLVLKLMTRMESNPDLVLSSRRTTRQLVLQTFSRTILCSEEEIDFNEALSIRIVEYLMDNQAEVFAQPEELKKDVEDRLVYLRRGQIQYLTGEENKKPTTAPSYCQKMSVPEYEAQKLSHSQKAITDLLEVIISDHNMTSKDKKKKLKQFQKTYPEIYGRRLPTTASEAALFPEKPKIKAPIVNVRKSFTKLKSLR
ncbi:DEP domain-containing protein 1A-like [Asterias amurensis]|uniref:DEP domain-containing protein 1A-like n=1 Tax=Asterias amurensis TaxID=7602 RepID=UPI003AB56E88